MLDVSETISNRIIDHIRNGTTDLADTDMLVPIAHFSDEEYAKREIDAIRRQFLVAAHHSELPEPGTFLTRDILGTSLLIVRRQDGAVAACLNMCRHRGGKVELAEKGKKKFFVCSYHGWSYAQDGALRGVPYEDTFDSIEKSCRSLIPVRCEERHGFIWVNLDTNGTGDLQSFLGPLADEHMPSFDIPGTVIFRTETIELGVNWKIILDGATDILHPQFLHANTVGKLLSTAISAWQNLGRHGMSYSPRRRLLDCVRNEQPFNRDWRYFGANMYLWPNSMVLPTPDHIENWTVWPLAVDRSLIQIRFLVDKDRLDDTVASRINRSWEILREAALTEDFPMEETIQSNAGSHGNGTFIYGRSEISCQQLHREMARELAVPS
ncbi:aromatic ring-hydroxylating dioxygenase subunit alpha [Sphingobium sp. EM0848]|uniref:aromatic ring-hydroxylating oxygenase subunit alpha n=1 Tax=Sphingobium sp. EM0848 TaxID=2743473 RepID=UPI00159C48EB|nr:aromatic ring-hydroxylating dioxygenase subunit alpha [Sphingobium sp. EM0848]